MILAIVMPWASIGQQRQLLRQRFARETLQVVPLGIFEPRVPVTARVAREGVPSGDYLVTLQSSLTGAPLVYYSQHAPATQWFARAAIYQEVIATAYEYAVPRLGITRWPTVSETADAFLFNLTEDSGNSGPSTVDAVVSVVASVDSQRSVREAVIVERMDDGQWRVAGYGTTGSEVANTLNLKVTPTGVRYAFSIDDYGMRFVPGLAVEAGQRVRPLAFSGWLYLITEAGVLPDAEPQWWAAEGDNAPRLLGTARAIAVRYYQPLAHGPVPVEII